MSRNSTGYTGQLEPRRREFLSLVATLLPQETHDILLQTLNLFQLSIAICVYFFAIVRYTMVVKSREQIHKTNNKSQNTKHIKGEQQ